MVTADVHRDSRPLMPLATYPTSVFPARRQASSGWIDDERHWYEAVAGRSTCVHLFGNPVGSLARRRAVHDDRRRAHESGWIHAVLDGDVTLTRLGVGPL